MPRPLQIDELVDWRFARRAMRCDIYFARCAVMRDAAAARWATSSQRHSLMQPYRFRFRAPTCRFLYLLLLLMMMMIIVAFAVSMPRSIFDALMIIDAVAEVSFISPIPALSAR